MPKHLMHKEKPQGVNKKKALKKLAPEVREALKREQEKHAQQQQQQQLLMRQPAATPAVEKVQVGRVILLAHGVGASSSHSSMKAWKQRLSHLADAVIMVDFTRPYKMSTQTAAFVEALRAAKRAGHGRAVLVGVGMGAQVALHLLSGAACDDCDDGEGVDAAEPIPAPLRELVVGAVALGLPLLKVGSTTPRDAALRALPADAPPLLLVSGSSDQRMSFEALDAARAASACRSTVHVVEGADAALRLPSGTQLEKDGTAALDDVLGTFFGETLGSAAEASREIWAPVGGMAAVAKLPKVAKPPKSAASTAAKDAELEELQRENKRQQLELKQLSKEASRAANDAQREANEAARAAAKEAAARAEAKRVAPDEIVVTGCGSSEVNGTYRKDGTRDGVPSYRIVADERDGPSFTIERDSAPDQATQYCLCVDYGFVTWAFVDSDGYAPPASGWQVSEESGCCGPPPTLSAAPGSSCELPIEPELHEEASDEEDAAAMGDGGAVASTSAKPSTAKKWKKASKSGFRVSRGIQKKMNGLRRKAKG